MRLPTNYDPNLEGQKKDPNTGEITIGGKKAQLTKTEEPELTKTEEPESTKIKISRLMAAAGIGTNILSGARALGDSMFGPTGSTVPGAVGAVGHSFQAAGNAVRTVTGKVPVHVLNKLRADRLLGNRRYRRHPKFSPK